MHYERKNVGCDTLNAYFFAYIFLVFKKGVDYFGQGYGCIHLLFFSCDYLRCTIRIMKKVKVSVMSFKEGYDVIRR